MGPWRYPISQAGTNPGEQEELLAHANAGLDLLKQALGLLNDNAGATRKVVGEANGLLSGLKDEGKDIVKDKVKGWVKDQIDLTPTNLTEALKSEIEIAQEGIHKIAHELKLNRTNFWVERDYKICHKCEKDPSKSYWGQKETGRAKTVDPSNNSSTWSIATKNTPNRFTPAYERQDIWMKAKRKVVRQIQEEAASAK